MDGLNKLKSLSNVMSLEPAEEAGVSQLSRREQDSLCISQAVLPNGKSMRLLKTLLTSACERNCYYCPFRAGRDFRRISFQPQELAQTYNALYRGGVAEGIFLSSGIIRGGIHAQDRLIETAEILRHRLHYQGYLHLKLMPGAEYDQVYRSMQLADRVSINLEAPNGPRLEKLAPGKRFMDELLQPLRWVEQIRKTQPAWSGWNRHWPSSTTQFVVGAVGENDVELLTTTEALFQQYGLARPYYSAFTPQVDTPFESKPAESHTRQLRLYQASFLLRDYNFSLEELPFDQGGCLPLDEDPKGRWARTNLLNAPVEINQASPDELIRIPGLGLKAVKSILAARKVGTINSTEDLTKIGIRPERATPYILLDGHRPPQQLSFSI